MWTILGKMSLYFRLRCDRGVNFAIKYDTLRQRTTNCDKKQPPATNLQKLGILDHLQKLGILDHLKSLLLVDRLLYSLEWASEEQLDPG